MSNPKPSSFVANVLFPNLHTPWSSPSECTRTPSWSIYLFTVMGNLYSDTSFSTFILLLFPFFWVRERGCGGNYFLWSIISLLDCLLVRNWSLGQVFKLSLSFFWLVQVFFDDILCSYIIRFLKTTIFNKGVFVLHFILTFMKLHLIYRYKEREVFSKVSILFCCSNSLCFGFLYLPGFFGSFFTLLKSSPFYYFFIIRMLLFLI